MNKLTFLQTDLLCLMQAVEVITPNQSHTGLLTRSDDGTFRFEEAIRRRRAPRNLKLFDGEYISMVRMQNGRYHLHLKTFSEDLDRRKYAVEVYLEISNALKILD